MLASNELFVKEMRGNLLKDRFVIQEKVIEKNIYTIFKDSSKRIICWNTTMASLKKNEKK